MTKGVVKVYYGDGRGKSSSAFGHAVLSAAKGDTAILIEFLKKKVSIEGDYLKRLEPELKLFRFAKSEKSFAELSESEKLEESQNLKNGFNYGKKVISTAACDVLVLDEILGLVDEKIIDIEDLKNVLEMRPEEMTIILTGRKLPEAIKDDVDEIYCIMPE